MELAVSIPSGVEVKVEGGIISVSGPKGKVSKNLNAPDMKVRQEGGKVTFRSADDRKKNIAVVGTWAAHLQNMIKGVTSGWELRMKVVYSHFPIKLSVEGGSVIIGNYLGERGQRKAKIMEGSAVKLDKEGLIITGIDKESVGQTAANIELASRVKGRDRRVFQDGVYVVQGPQPISAEGKK
ncbi:MAG: 50S ribosomal protein L6 [Candidatus Aenigmarchaeota archaeon]|nr:50S ribosomal protein L6 [Candidatus Aenigmarchaeota archaeon]